MKRVFIIIALLCLSAMFAAAQTTAFNFQGRLNDGNNPANGRYDLQFKLYDQIAGGNPVGATIDRPNLMLVNGVFSTQLDFGAAAFAGGNRFIEIQLRPAGSPNAYVILGARQQIMSVPYSVKSLNATNADNAMNATNATTAQTAVNSQQLGSLPASRYLATDTNGDVTINGKVTFNGNVYQPVTAAGLPKAFIVLDRNGVITNCYNAVTGQSANNCGFTTNHPRLGTYGINFGFSVLNKIIIVTSNFDAGHTVASVLNNDTTISIFVHYIYSYDNGASDAGKYTDASFSVVVY